jgi:F0F1-type ATP synthase membrane subunit b/b'
LARIAQEEARALQDVRSYAAMLTARTTERLLRDQIDGPKAQALVDDAIAEVGRKLA